VVVVEEGGLRKTDKVREREKEREAAFTLNMFRLASLNSAMFLSPFSLSSFQVRNCPTYSKPLQNERDSG